MRWLNSELLPVDTSPSGLQFGDGVFETLRYERGGIRLWARHWARLCRGMGILGLAPLPDEYRLLDLLSTALKGCLNAVVKVMVVRHVAQRGYAAGSGWCLSIQVTEGLPSPPQRVSLCILGPKLSGMGLGGIKHMNRLEQVLATRALNGRAWEGGLCTREGDLVEGIRTNLLIVGDAGDWYLPDCADWGVNGVMRAALMDWLSTRKQAVLKTPVPLSGVRQARAVAVMNSLYGILPVSHLDERELDTGFFSAWLPEFHAQIDRENSPLGS